MAEEIFAEDVRDHNPCRASPRAAPALWVARMVRTAFPDPAFTPDVVTSDGEYVAGRWTMSATNTGPIELFGMPPTGRPVTMTGQEIFRFAGASSPRWHQEDVGGMLNALGLEPPPFMMRLAARRSARQYRRHRRRTPAPSAST